MCTFQRGWFWKFLWWLFVGNYITTIISKLFRVNDQEAFNECKSKLREVFAELDDLVIKKKTVFLSGDRIGATDIALAALSSCVILPKEYAHGKYHLLFDKIERNDPELRRELEYFRNTETGKYVLWLYKEHRMDFLKKH